MPSSVFPRPSDPASGAENGVFETLYGAIPFALAVVDRSRLLVFANSAFIEDWMPGLRIPAPFAELFHPGDRDAIDARLKSSTGAGSENLELRVTGPDGSLRWALAGFAPLGQNLNGQILAIVQLTDITEQKRQIQELSDRESRWNNALVSSVFGVWDHNYATGEKYYSQVWRDIRGLSPDDRLASTTEEWLQQVHPDDRGLIVHAMERQNAGDPAFAEFEYRERHKKGHWIWILCRGGPIERDADGKSTRVVGTDTDITAKKDAEEAAARMSRRLDMALEISGIGVYESDFNTGEVDWDERMFRIYRLEKTEEVKIGGLWESMLHPDDASRVLANVDDNSSEGRRFSDEYRIVLRDGSERVIRTRTMSFIDGSGHRRMVGANWDVTADVMLHRELERAKILAEARNIELEAARISIEHSAMHDYLTGLPNRRYLDEMLDRVASECARDDQGIAILHIDLDRFKEINDTLGHGAGDTMLKHAATILKSTIRKGDFVARLGGDEFVIMSKFRGSPQKLSNLAERVVIQLSKPVRYGGHDCHFGASVGIACETGPSVDARQLLLNADIALYRAKNGGRNRHEFF